MGSQEARKGIVRGILRNGEKNGQWNSCDIKANIIRYEEGEQEN